MQHWTCTNRVLAVLAVLVVLTGLAGCTAPASDPLPTVTVSMYSGRPDPVFTLTPSQADELRACLQDPAGRPDRGRPADGLGFRYFEVNDLQQKPVLIGTTGAWLGGPDQPTPIAACPNAFGILRAAAAGALPSADVDNIPVD